MSTFVLRANNPSRSRVIESLNGFVEKLNPHKNWRVIVEPHSEPRSNPQCRYLNGVAYKLLGDADGREPTMADLRDSGRIEEDADGVFLLHRPGYYDPSKNAGYTKLILGKLRGGKRETLEVFMDLSRMRVEVCERDHVPVSAPKKEGFARITKEWA